MEVACENITLESCLKVKRQTGAFPSAVWPELQYCNIACDVDEIRWPDPEDADSHSLYKLFHLLLLVYVLK